MSSDKEGRLSEEMAERLWKRAAELQADAARRLESKSRTEAHLELVESDDSGYALQHVRQAAVEAGISTEFVEAALTELKTEVAITPETRSMWDGLAKTIIGPSPAFLEVRREIPATPQQVSQALERILLAAPYELSIRDLTGDLLNGGVMVFDIPQITGLGGYSTFVYECSWASLKQLMISLHPSGTDSCLLVIRSPTRGTRRLGAGMGTVFAGGAGVAGGAGGVGLGMAIGTGLGLATGGLVPLVGGVALLGAGAFSAASRAVFRKVFHYGLGRAQKALEGLAGAINTSFVAGWGGGASKALPETEGKRMLTPPE